MINVFICTYQPNPEFLRRTIESIQRQDLDPAKWDLTVIDNNSKQPVADLDIIKKMNVKTVVERKQGLTAARGCATAISTADLLVFVDDDNILDPTYLSSVADIFNKDPRLAIISGDIRPEYVKQPEPWFAPFEPMLAIRKIDSDEQIIYNQSVKYSSTFPIGAGMSVRAAFIKDYYDNHLTAAGNYIDGRKGDALTASEDIDLDLFALSKGLKIAVTPRLRMLHIIPEGRIDPDYIIKLAAGSIKSAGEVNAKWHKTFNTMIFDYVKANPMVLRLKLLLSKLLSFKKPHYIKAGMYKELLKYN